MREQNRLEHIISILEQYLKTSEGNKKSLLPLHIFLQNHFRKNRQMGSKDRRIASSSIYNYFRLGKSLENIEANERMAIGSFLCETETNPFLDYLFSLFQWLESKPLNQDLDQKLNLIKEKFTDFSPSDIFPFHPETSNEIKAEIFSQSFLMQPKVYLRLKNGFEKEVTDELGKLHIPYEYPLYLPQALALEHTKGINEMKSKKSGYFEIQDLSSQETGEYFKAKPRELWWDCCAGSGGKSLMLMDKEPGIKLTASDIRPQIIENLKQRFKTAGIKKVRTTVIDLSKEKIDQKEIFDGIIADVPCTGSGTWGRTPEMLQLFDVSEIEAYAEKQRKIVASALPALKKGKHLIYITCSVFSKENEEQLKFFEKEFGLEAVSSKLIKGFEHRADTLFVARLRKVFG